MKNELVKNITAKIGYVMWNLKFKRPQDKLLKLQKEVLHIKKHIIWMEDILDKEIKSMDKEYLTPPK